MTEVNKGIGKAQLGLLILTVLVIVLSVSIFWVYTSLQRQIGTLRTDKKNLNIQVNILQAEKNVLESEVSTLESQVLTLEADKSNLWSEIVYLEDEIDDRGSEIINLLREIEWLKQIAEKDNFQFYYASLAKQRYDVYDLEEYLDRWEWTEGDYVEGVFDCSEMSAYVEWKLESEGYHTYIVCGDTPWGGGGRHAWLLVETSEDAYMPVEATEYNIIWWSNPYFDNYFEYDYLFETIQDALDYCYSEFDWWN